MPSPDPANAKRTYELSYGSFFWLTAVSLISLLCLSLWLTMEFQSKVEKQQEKITNEAILNVLRTQRNSVNLEMLRLSLESLAYTQDFEVARQAYIRAWGMLSDATVQGTPETQEVSMQLMVSVQQVWADRLIARQLRESIAQKWNHIFHHLLTVASLSNGVNESNFPQLQVLLLPAPSIGVGDSEFVKHIDRVNLGLQMLCSPSFEPTQPNLAPKYRQTCSHVRDEVADFRISLQDLLSIKRGIETKVAELEKQATSYRRDFTQIENTNLLDNIRGITRLTESVRPHLSLTILADLIAGLVLLLVYIAIVKPIRAATIALEDFLKNNVVPQNLPFSLVKEINLLLDWVNNFCVSMFHERTKALLVSGEYEELRRKWTIDPVTGVANRQSFEELVNNYPIAPAQSAFMMIDLDYFKEINDTRGHPFGDRLLGVIGETLRNTLTANDLIYRYGGDEFCVLLNGVTPKTLESMANRLREQMSHISRTSAERREGTAAHPMTLSIGISPITKVGEEKSFSTMVREADQALYAAKHAGRNTFRHYQESVVAH